MGLRYHYRLSSMAITRGTQLFVVVVVVVVGYGRGHLYFGADIVLLKHHVNDFQITP